MAATDLKDHSPKRVAARVLTREILARLADQADRLNLDLLDTLIFSGIWTANTEHLSDPDRFATVFDLPPNAERRRVSVAEVAVRLRLSPTLVKERVKALESAHLVESSEAGLIVPTAVFTRPEALNGIDATWKDAQRLTNILASFGLEPTPQP